MILACNLNIYLIHIFYNINLNKVYNHHNILFLNSTLSFDINYTFIILIIIEFINQFNLFIICITFKIIMFDQDGIIQV